MTAQLEHLNITVPDPKATADMFCQVFGWRIRWEGPAIDGGHSIHVGSDETYVALYAPSSPPASAEPRYLRAGGLNHLGVTVNDIEATEAAFRRLGHTPHNHADYEPGRRFYVSDENGLEIEVVQYD